MKQQKENKQMKDGWKEYRIKDICQIIGGYAFKSRDFKAEGDIPVIKIKSLKDKKIVISGGEFVDDIFLELNEKYHINFNDYIIALTGSHITLPSSAVGRVSKSTHKRTLLLNQRVGKFKVNPELCCHDFLYHFLTTDYFFQNIGLRAKGAANQANVSTGDVGGIKINIPPLPTQGRIAAILSAYDDLIENNLKRIKLLEEMAQINYEEWFVRMKFPGHETAAFDKETGLPEGWKKERLKNYITIKHGYAYKGEFFTELETDRILLTPGNFKIGGGIQLNKIKFYSDEAECPKDYILKRNDLLLTMTDLSKMGDTLGYPLLIPSSDKVFLHNQRLGKVQLIKGDFLPKYFLYFLFKEEGYRAFVVGSSSGATVKHTSPNKILSYKAKFPDLEGDIVKGFERHIKPIFDNIDNLQTQNQRLKEARDILLPRLMTGRIDVDGISGEVDEKLNS